MTHDPRPAGLPLPEKLAALVLAGLIAAPAWLRGGTHAPWMHSAALAAAAAAPLLLVLLLWRRKAAPHPARPEGGRPRRLLADPIFWIGLLFLALLATQWWNTGRALFYDAKLAKWDYSPPPHPGFPFSFTAGEARQMLDWYFPGWLIVIALRSALFSPAGIRLVWRLLAAHAALLALFGIAQFSTHTTSMYWRLPMEVHFFAAFGYQNHAGSYFLMALPLAAGLLCFELGEHAAARSRIRVAILAAAMLLSLVGANLSLSRSAILLSWAMLLPLAVLSVAYFWPRIGPARSVNLVAAGAGVLCLAALLTFGLGRQAIPREFQPEKDHKSFFLRETDYRAFQLRTAARVWHDHPWFGVGGWGYRYLMAHYLAPADWRRITPGKANVHNDPLQALVEFGVVGAGALAAVVAVLLAAVFRARSGWPPVALFPVLGAGVVGLQSLIDLPFRSPAVLYLWLACLAGAARAAGRIAAARADVRPRRGAPGPQGTAAIPPPSRGPEAAAAREGTSRPS